MLTLKRRSYAAMLVAGTLCSVAVGSPAGAASPGVGQPGVTALPDISVSISAPASVNEGAVFEVRESVCNNGALRAGAHTVKRGLWPGTFWSRGALAGNSCVNSTTSHTASINPFNPSLSRQFVVWADVFEVVNELHEDNNLRTVTVRVIPRG